MKRRLKVIIVDNNKVLQISKEPKKNSSATLGRGLKYYKQSLTVDQNGANNLPPIPEDFDECHIFFKPTALVENDEEKDSFGFRTPSKSGNMLEKAGSALKRSGGNTPRTPTNCGTPRTPQTPSTPTGRSCRISKALYRTPTSTSKGSTRRTSRRLSTSVEVPETPSAYRAKVKNRIKNIVYKENSESDIDDSDLDGNYSPSDSGDDSSPSETEDSIMDLNQNETPKRRKGLFKALTMTPLRTPRRGRESKVDVDMVGSNDDYFVHNSSETNGCVTSDHTLSKLENPRLGPEALKGLLEGISTNHETERMELLQDHTTLFPHWMMLMCQGFSVFVCGVGSKKKLLCLFQSHLLSEVDHLVVNGFFPSLSVKTILTSILEEIMEADCRPQGLNDQLNHIEGYYSTRGEDPLFLIVHNLDGPMLRQEKAQSVLARLASFDNVHLIASFDHINAPLIFDSSKSSSYSPLWFDVTTLAPYSEETSYENSLLVQQSGSLVLSSLIHVFKSLTPNAKGIFLLLAKYQLAEKDSSTYIGLSFGDLYNRCRESFLVNSDLTLRAQLTEFKDHKLIKTKKGYDGVDNLIIPLDSSTLQEFLDQHQDD